jgi:hypothetical protein
MEDVVTPQFKVLSGKGKIVNSPLYSRKVEEIYPKWSFESSLLNELYSSTAKRWYDRLKMESVGSKNLPLSTLASGSSFFLQPADITSDVASLQARAITKSWANIDSSEIYALVSLMESGKTINGILDTVRRLRKFARNLKRLQLAEIRKDALIAKKAYALSTKFYSPKAAWKSLKGEFSLNSLADRYMEIRYGWRPLYYDLVGATNAFNKQFEALRQTFRGRTSDSYTGSGTASIGLVGQPWGQHFVLLNQSYTVDVVCRAGVLCDVDLSLMDPWGLSKLPESAFDLIPCSFVFDWFFNLSDTLGAWTPNLGFTALASWIVTTKVTTQLTTVVGTTSTYDPDTSTKRYSGEISCDIGKTYAKITTEKWRLPDPSRSVLPSWNPRLNVAKLTDLAIILKNLLYGGRYPLMTKNLRI